MQGTHVRDSLDAYIDDELSVDEAAAVRAHLAECVDCTRAYDALTRTSQMLQQGLMRHAAPDVLRARIINAIAEEESGRAVEEERVAPRAVTRTLGWWRLAAAGIAIAVASSATTYTVARRGAGDGATEDAVVASHIRSLMPGHLIDVASSDQHNVKPWFNGRIDSSPQVPGLDSSGFNLVGGRLDYVAGKRVAAVVYGRRQHLINVYSWPESGRNETPASSETHGYHMIRWRNDNVEYFATSDLNMKELSEFVGAFQRVSGGTAPTR